MGFFLALLILLIIVFLVFYPVYLGLIIHKDLILKRLAAVDALLINRQTLVTKIITDVEKIMEKESDTIQKVKKILMDSNKIKIRWNNNEERFKLENELDIQLNIFLTAAMQYPSIESNIYFKKTIDNFVTTQTLLITAINEYNTTLTNYKMMIDSPPGVILTPMLKINCKFTPYYIPKN